MKRKKAKHNAEELLTHLLNHSTLQLYRPRGALISPSVLADMHVCVVKRV